MLPEFEEIPLLRNETSRHFEIAVEGKKAFIEFEVREGKMFLTRAEVPLAFQSNGVGDALVEKTLLYLEENKLPLVPMCPFVASYLRKYPEWKRVLAKGIQIGARERF